MSGAKFCQIAGRCVTDGAGKYGNKESCRVVALRPFFLVSIQYDVEKGYDYLTVGNIQFKNGYGPWGQKMNKGAALVWKSDGSGVREGWKVCATEPTSTGEVSGWGLRFVVKVKVWVRMRATAASGGYDWAWN